MSVRDALLENIVIDEVEARLKQEVERWFDKLPLYNKPNEVSHNPEYYSKLNALVEKISKIKLGKDRDSKIKDLVVKWLQTLHFLPGQEILIKKFACDLENRLKDLQEDKIKKDQNELNSKRNRLTKSKTYTNLTLTYRNESVNTVHLCKNNNENLLKRNNNVREGNQILKSSVLVTKSLSTITTAELIQEITREWCAAVQRYLDDKCNQRLLENLAIKIVNKINEFNNDFHLLNDDILYDILLDGALEKYISKLPQTKQLLQMQDTLKYELKESIRLIKPLIKEERLENLFKSSKNFGNDCSLSDTVRLTESDVVIKSFGDRNDIFKKSFESSSETETSDAETVKTLKRNLISNVFVSLESSVSGCDPNCSNQQISSVAADQGRLGTMRRTNNNASGFHSFVETSSVGNDTRQGCDPSCLNQQTHPEQPRQLRPPMVAQERSFGQPRMSWITLHRQQGECSPICEAVGPSPSPMFRRGRGRRYDPLNSTTEYNPTDFSDHQAELEHRWRPGADDPQMPEIPDTLYISRRRRRRPDGLQNSQSSHDSQYSTESANIPRTSEELFDKYWRNYLYLGHSTRTGAENFQTPEIPPNLSQHVTGSFGNYYEQLHPGDINATVQNFPERDLMAMGFARPLLSPVGLGSAAMPGPSEVVNPQFRLTPNNLGDEIPAEYRTPLQPTIGRNFIPPSAFISGMAPVRRDLAMNINSMQSPGVNSIALPEPSGTAQPQFGSTPDNLARSFNQTRFSAPHSSTPAASFRAQSEQVGVPTHTQIMNLNQTASPTGIQATMGSQPTTPTSFSPQIQSSQYVSVNQGRQSVWPEPDPTAYYMPQSEQGEVPRDTQLELESQQLPSSFMPQFYSSQYGSLNQTGRQSVSECDPTCPNQETSCIVADQDRSVTMRRTNNNVSGSHSVTETSNVGNDSNQGRQPATIASVGPQPEPAGVFRDTQFMSLNQTAQPDMQTQMRSRSITPALLGSESQSFQNSSFNQSGRQTLRQPPTVVSAGPQPEQAEVFRDSQFMSLDQTAAPGMQTQIGSRSVTPTSLGSESQSLQNSSFNQSGRQSVRQPAAIASIGSPPEQAGVFRDSQFMSLNQTAAPGMQTQMGSRPVTPASFGPQLLDNSQYESFDQTGRQSVRAQRKQELEELQRVYNQLNRYFYLLHQMDQQKFPPGPAQMQQAPPAPFVPPLMNASVVQERSIGQPAPQLGSHSAFGVFPQMQPFPQEEEYKHLWQQSQSSGMQSVGPHSIPPASFVGSPTSFGQPIGVSSPIPGQVVPGASYAPQQVSPVLAPMDASIAHEGSIGQYVAAADQQSIHPSVHDHSAWPGVVVMNPQQSLSGRSIYQQPDHFLEVGDEFNLADRANALKALRERTPIYVHRRPAGYESPAEKPLESNIGVQSVVSIPPDQGRVQFTEPLHSGSTQTSYQSWLETSGSGSSRSSPELQVTRSGRYRRRRVDRDGCLCLPLSRPRCSFHRRPLCLNPCESIEDMLLCSGGYF